MRELMATLILTTLSLTSVIAQASNELDDMTMEIVDPSELQGNRIMLPDFDDLDTQEYRDSELGILGGEDEGLSGSSQSQSNGFGSIEEDVRDSALDEYDTPAAPRLDHPAIDIYEDVDNYPDGDT